MFQVKRNPADPGGIHQEVRAGALRMTRKTRTRRVQHQTANNLCNWGVKYLTAKYSSWLRDVILDAASGRVLSLQEEALQWNWYSARIKQMLHGMLRPVHVQCRWRVLIRERSFLCRGMK